MERLTHPRSSGIKTGYWSPEKKDALIERLAAYEDTGLTPQEIYSLKAGTILKAIGAKWIPVKERLPEDDNYILLSFENFGIPLIGRYEADNDSGGAFYLGDNDEQDTCISENLFVNAWMPLPRLYQGHQQPDRLRRDSTPQERTRAKVYATGNKWAVENFNDTHN